MWRRTRGPRTSVQAVLIALLAAIGLGSYLFHTHARPWAALADVAPIAAFVLVYVSAAKRDFWGLPAWAASLGAAGFLPYAALTVPIFAALPFLKISAVYWPVPLLIALYAVVLRRRAPVTARGFSIGAAILVASLTIRSLDGIVREAIPVGTHFLWHVLDGAMLGWMIEVHRRHLERARALS
jgi:hypothetical protein